MAMASLNGALLLSPFTTTPRYKWDSNPPHLQPETGLLALRSGLGVFANRRPATVLVQGCFGKGDQSTSRNADFHELVDASTLKREIAEVDIMAVRELIGGIYCGEPREFDVNESGHRYAYKTMVYSTPEIDRIARVGFETARTRQGRLCSVDKANVLQP